MATGAMLWNGAAYNNGILPFKRGVLGEAYTRHGEGALLVHVRVADGILGVDVAQALRREPAPLRKRALSGDAPFTRG